MKQVILVIVISIFHFVIGIWLSIKSFGHAFSVFDTGRDLTLLEKINYIIVEILFFPIVLIFEKSSYEGQNIFAQYLPFILNSILWGVLITYGCYFILKINNLNRSYK